MARACPLAATSGIEAAPFAGQGSTTIWYRAESNTTGVERSAEVVFYDSQTLTKVLVVQHPTPAVPCGDFDCDPPVDDCGWPGDSDPGHGGQGGGYIHDPWCDTLPYGSADPHCINVPFSLPTHPRMNVFGETSMCVG